MGELNVGGAIVDVVMTSTSDYRSVSTGTDYWTGDAYTNGTIDNAPTGAELVQLNEGGTVTLTFSSAIQDIYIALISWNGNTVDFGTPITFDSVGEGYWGTGSATLNAANTGFTTDAATSTLDDELHGVVKIEGDFTSITFTHLTEEWHGFTLGVAQISVVPTPPSLLLMR